MASSSNIENKTVDNNTLKQQIARADARVAVAELNRLAVSAQDPTQDPSTAAKSVATTVNSVVQELNTVLSNVQSQVQSGAPTASLRSQFDSANNQLSQVQSAVGKANNALFAAGSPVRLQWSGNGVQVANVNTASAATGNTYSSSATPSGQWTDGLASDPGGPSTSGLQLDTQDASGVDPQMKNSPMWNMLVTAIKDVVQQLVAQQNGTSTTQSPTIGSTSATSSTSAAPTSTAATSSVASTSTAPTSGVASNTSTTPHAYSPNASTAGEPGSSTAGEGLGAQNGEGSAIMNMLLKSLKNAQDQQNGGTGTNSKGGKSSKAAVPAGHAGTTTNQAFAAPPSTSTQASTGSTSVNNPGQYTVAGNDDIPIGNGAGNSVPDTAGAGGDPMVGQANINGLLMMVLLECYQDGQKDLQSLATRLQDINNQKKGVRSQLDGLRSANGGASGNSAQVQNLEDQLNSMGDDAQMEQLDLQNMAQNQQQLLQMISDFSKNTNTNSMAIIRNIAG